MRKRRRRGGSPGSIGLFYFQDVIFLTIGIVILVSALLSVSKRVALLSSRSEFDTASLEERLNSAMVELLYWKTAKRFFEGDLEGTGEKPVEAVRADAVLAAANVKGVEADRVFLATGGLTVLRGRDAGALKRRQTEVAAVIAELLELERSYRANKQVLLELESGTGRVLVRPDAEGSLRQPLVMLLSGKRLVVYLLAEKSRALTLDAPFGEEMLQAFFAGLEREEIHALLLLKPSGMEHFSLFRNWMLSNEVAFGYEPVSEFYEFDLEVEQVLEVYR